MRVRVAVCDLERFCEPVAVAVWVSDGVVVAEIDGDFEGDAVRACDELCEGERACVAVRDGVREDEGVSVWDIERVGLCVLVCDCDRVAVEVCDVVWLCVRVLLGVPEPVLVRLAV